MSTRSSGDVVAPPTEGSAVAVLAEEVLCAELVDGGPRGSSRTFLLATPGALRRFLSLSWLKRFSVRNLLRGSPLYFSYLVTCYAWCTLTQGQSGYVGDP